MNTFRATGTARSTISISADGRVLRVRGIYVDSIEAITKPLKEGDPAALDFASGRGNYLCDFERTSRGLVYKYKSILRYPPSEGLTNGLWRTLICDMTKDIAGDLTRLAPSSFAGSYLAYLQLQDLMTSTDTEAAMRDDLEAVEKIVREAQAFIGAFEPDIKGRRFCVTQEGYTGLVPTSAAKGDSICVFLGSAVPFVIRKTGSDKFSLVGECYVHGMMDGKALDMVLDVDWMDEGDIVLE